MDCCVPAFLISPHACTMHEGIFARITFLSPLHGHTSCLEHVTAGLLGFVVLLLSLPAAHKEIDPLLFGRGSVHSTTADKLLSQVNGT